MANLAATHPTLLDMGKALGPNRRNVQAVIEILDEVNPVLQDAPVMEGNLPYGHQYGVRRYLPKGTWRRLYQGVQPTKSARDQVVEQAARIEAYSEVDAAMPGDINGLRASEARAHVEGIGQQLAEAFFYGDNRVNPAQFNGLAMRYNDRAAANGQNIIRATTTGASANNRSIWFIAWGENMCSLFYPQARQTNDPVPKGVAGVQHEDQGRVTIENLNNDGGRMEAYRDHFVAELGLTVPDWRCVVRIANVDVDALNKDRAMSGNQDLADLWTRAMHRIGGNKMPARVTAYADREVVAWFQRQQLHDKREFLPWERPVGARSIQDARMISVGGIPFKAVDALNTDEEHVA